MTAATTPAIEPPAMYPEATRTPLSPRSLAILPVLCALPDEIRDDSAEEDRRVELDREVHPEREGERRHAEMARMSEMMTPNAKRIHWTPAPPPMRPTMISRIADACGAGICWEPNWYVLARSIIARAQAAADTSTPVNLNICWLRGVEPIQ